MESTALVTPWCFFCDTRLTWDKAVITFFGKVLCQECDGGTSA